jgi:FAD/FMN-containing dehydrogenase
MCSHTPFAGAANIQAGITIDLSKFNQVTVASNRQTVDIGPGNRWRNVYSQLDAKNLATSGGRVATVGVGGLTTGGGISFFSPRYGFVCDNVENFEVVLASGQIVNANSKTNSDLWRALRGGSNNFGIVTKITHAIVRARRVLGRLHRSGYLDNRPAIPGILQLARKPQLRSLRSSHLQLGV